MPELPEVETLVRGLRATLPGRSILSVRLGKTDFIDDPALLERDLPGNRITEIVRHGKFFLLHLESSNGARTRASLLVHLGMTGHLAAFHPAEPVAKHTHALFTLDDGRELRYTDPRRFGRMAFIPQSQLASLLASVGADPLEVSDDEFCARLHTRRAMTKALLLDQAVLRGIGNIYADESLWRARIHPARRAAALPPRQLRNLIRAIRKILNEAIRLGGSSISDYRNAEGQPGWFQLRHRVYDREGKPCARCRTRIRRTIVAGRSSYFCPRCQPAPRPRKPAPHKRR